MDKDCCFFSTITQAKVRYLLFQWILAVYKVLALCMSPLIKLFFIMRCFVSKKDSLKQVRERFGHIPSKYRSSQSYEPVIWIHVASVGEFLSVKKLVNELLDNNQNLYILLTSTTLTASNLIQAFAYDRILHQLVPADVPTWISSFLNFWKPEKAIFVESEIWPNWLFYLKKRKIKTILLNARISDSSFARWKLFSWVAYEIFQFFDLCIAQNIETLERLNYFKANNCYYLGNLKNFSDPLIVNQNLLDQLNEDQTEIFGVTFASTHEGEEDQIFQVISSLWEKDPQYRFILAPRHPHRVKAIISLCKRYNLEFITLSELLRDEEQKFDVSKSVVIVDLLGYLGTFYKFSSVVFIGGSFAKIGGHNPIEAIRLGRVVCFGQHMHNFKDIVASIEKIYDPYVANSDELIHFIQMNRENVDSYNQKISKFDEFFDIDISFFKDIVRLILT